MQDKNNDILCNVNSADFPQKLEGLSCIKHQSALHHSTADNTYSCNGSSVSGASFSVQVRREILLNLSFKQAKALALHIYVRMYQNANKNEAKDYTINRLHEITQLHAETIKKRIVMLENMSLIGYSDRKQIYFLKARAHNPFHNEIITIQKNTTVKEIEKIILTVRLQMKIRQKEYLRNVLCIARDGFKSDGKPAKLEEIKRAKRWLRGHCNFDWQKRGFVDYGWSYNAIAKYLGVSIKQAVECIKYATKNNFLIKEKHSMFKKLSNKLEQYFIQHTFSLGIYSYKVWANSYALCTGVN